ncbi:MULTISPECIES: NADH-quinone oxidoreductase subunit L [Fibrobacter]|uniref:NADH dehydrogenase subunit L n=1 Tax=Fibrobacter intestinalis TaxID=28122 RepID=A0A1T4LHZ7_9BACT|nr:MULTISPECIES: NADH-quinone oxidoreductase subunit L [Fibrobacter]MDD7300138.1 NADH-quinone oxidoreductase subunit L [Fibrobacter intestinalis]PBC66377.1 NADH dehydrogenase subunit L [Fibrobacter sp. UWS1]PBC74785.1 NADH dehydrogenase subunit L [Fibrobacter sp. NR9]SJZ54228.1 NADH dehydrogenase subunit L [Fibrobacter intestinalis]
MIPLWLIPLFPLAGTIVLALIAVASSDSKKGPDEGLVGFLGVLFPLLAFVATGLLAWNMPQDGIHQTLGSWIDSPLLSVHFGLLFDGLSRTMLLFITGIATLIILYSTGYMHKDRGFARFFAYMNLFLFSMVVLVLSDSLVLTFLGWEGVGLCSYLLIGFWNKDLNNCKAANKAFLVNRVGDVGFLLGMAILVTIGGSAFLNYADLTAWLVNPAFRDVLIANLPLLTVAGLLFFWACTAKSAQIPLLTWLPDAMAGPTPVSALIHAATMVTAGVYLVARLSPLFVRLPYVLTIIAIVGMLTAFWAAIAGLLQNDIKKVLAYSTISQLGYMFMAAGAAAFDVSIFHVFTHAFFKATLFLGAGAVMHALAGEQDMRKMGGLLKKTPITAMTMLFAYLAIIGFPGFSGFFSKDLILERLFAFNPSLGPVLYTIGLITAVITAVYMTRLMVLVFLGKYRGDLPESHIHEAPLSMTFPMVVLSIGSAFSGYAWNVFVSGANWFERWLAPVVDGAQKFAAAVRPEMEMEPSVLVFAILGTIAAVAGAFVGYEIFTRKRIPELKKNATTVPEGKAGCWTFFFDFIHNAFITAFEAAAWFVDAIIDKFIQILQWMICSIALILGDGIRNLQVRKIRLQVGFSIAGMVLIAIAVYFCGGLF